MELKNVTVKYDKINNIVHFDCGKNEVLPMYAYYLCQSLGIPLSCKVSFNDYTSSDTLDYYRRNEVSRF